MKRSPSVRCRKTYSEGTGWGAPAQCVCHSCRQTPLADTGSGRAGRQSRIPAPHHSHSPYSMYSAHSGLLPDSQTHYYTDCPAQSLWAEGETRQEKRGKQWKSKRIKNELAEWHSCNLLVYSCYSCKLVELHSGNTHPMDPGGTSLQQLSIK